MKKFIFSLCLLAFSAGFGFQTFATIHTILVGSYYFNPSSLTVQAGDTIRWSWVQGNHTTTSSSIPGGAPSWDSPINISVQSFDYVPSVEGFYQYVCTPHAAMGQTGNFTVTAPPPPPLTVTATADNNAVCLGQSTWLHAIPSGGAGGYSYSWTSVPPGFTSNQQNVQITPGITRTYQVTVTSGAQTANSSVAVSVTDPPNAQAGDDTTYCATIVQFPVSGSATNYSTVNWTTTGDGTFTDPSGLNSFYMPGVTDKTSPSVDLILTATAITPCTVSFSDTLHIILDPCLGTEEKITAEALRIYPNPSQGSFTLSGNTTGSSIIRIHDMQGRTVVEEKTEFTGPFTRSYDLSTQHGIYEVTVITGKKILQEKLVLTGK